jgi:hypothetical protein
MLAFELVTGGHEPWLDELDALRSSASRRARLGLDSRCPYFDGSGSTWDKLPPVGSNMTQPWPGK